MRIFIVALLSFGLGAGVMYLASDPSGSRAPARRESGEAASASSIRKLERDLAAARTREGELQATVRALQSDPVDRPAVESDGEGARGTEKAGVDSKAPRFVFAETDSTLRSLNWAEAGQAMADIMPLLSEAAAIGKGEKKMRPELFAEIMKAVGPLATMAMKLDAGEVAWGHPSVIVNLLHATLAQAEQPLDENQEKLLEEIGLRFIAANTQRAAGYPEGTLELRRIIDEVGVQDRLYEEVRQILNVAQRGVLYPPGVRGMVNLDVWSGPHVFNEKCERLRHTTREDLRETMQAELIKEFRLRSELSESLAALVRTWEEGFTDEFLAVKPGPAQEYEAAAVAAARAMTVAARQLSLFEAMVGTLPLSDKERERIVESDTLWLPMLRG